MRSPARKPSVSCAAALALALLGTGCTHLHWPWHHLPPAPPVAVHELEVTGVGADTHAQYWKRNTLLLDLSSASGSGTLNLKPVEGTSWPVRIGVRVTPGAFAALEVRGDQRQLLPISSSGGAPIDLELTPGVYTAKTPQITLSWGNAAAAAVQSTAPALSPH